MRAWMIRFVSHRSSVVSSGLRLKAPATRPAVSVFQGKALPSGFGFLPWRVVGSAQLQPYMAGMSPAGCARELAASRRAGDKRVMARGVDGSSHRGALAAGGKTFGVLGGGVDVCYPEENRDIYMRLESQGAA